MRYVRYNTWVYCEWEKKFIWKCLCETHLYRICLQSQSHQMCNQNTGRKLIFDISFFKTFYLLLATENIKVYFRSQKVRKYWADNISFIVSLRYINMSSRHCTLIGQLWCQLSGLSKCETAVALAPPCPVSSDKKFSEYRTSEIPLFSFIWNFANMWIFKNLLLYICGRGQQ